MEQHPIPQNVTSYEFKLVGEMTLKQFIKAAAGIVVAILLNTSKLVFFIKYPLMGLFAGGGLALAFMPIQDRPLEVWVKAFFRSIYAPTVMVFKKRAPYNWLDIDWQRAIMEEKKRQVDEGEVELIKDKGQVGAYFGSMGKFVAAEEKAEKEEKADFEADAAKVLEGIKGKKESEKAAGEKTEQVGENVEAVVKEMGTEVAGGVRAEAKKVAKLGATGQVVFGAIPMPDIPEVPNLLVGMVTDSQGKIVEEAIVEVQNEGGVPVRVMKTNTLGQFRTSTQLANGRYLVITEKDGMNFDRVHIDLLGEIIQPVKIKALA